MIPKWLNNMFNTALGHLYLIWLTGLTKFEGLLFKLSSKLGMLYLKFISKFD